MQRNCYIQICFGHFTENFDESYQLRGGVYFVDELPLTVSGKIIQRIARMHAEKEFNSRKICCYHKNVKECIKNDPSLMFSFRIFLF